MTGKTEARRIRKGLSLYKQPQRNGRGSPYWYARVYMKIGDRSLHTRSTETTDIRLAEKKAEELYVDCLKMRDGDLRGISSSVRTKVAPERRFDRVADQYLDRIKVEAGTNERGLRRLSDTRHSIMARNGFAAFFGKRDVSSITTLSIRDFLSFQIEKSMKGSLSTSSQKRSLSVLSQILKFAYENGLVSNVPLMPRIRVKQEPRGWFDVKEYRSLYVRSRVLSRAANKEGNEKEFRHWKEMANFVVFMVNTFLRPSEWSDLKHRHVKVVSEPDWHLELSIKGKTGSRTVLSMPRAVQVYERIVRDNGGDPDQYLFRAEYENRQTAKERMRDQFEDLLRKTNLKQSPFDRNRSLYSLRHSSLMFRLIYGDNVNLLALARNAGTSVDQLERFYLSHMQTKMLIENLQSFKKKQVDRKLFSNL